MTKEKRAVLPPSWTSCSVGTGIQVDIDYEHRMMWIIAEVCTLSLALGIDDFHQFGYNVGDGTLSIVLRSALQYVEIPCSRCEAEALLRNVGWDPGKLLIQAE